MKAASQGANQHIRNSLGFSILPKDTSTCGPGESDQQPSDNKTLALPLSRSHPFSPAFNICDMTSPAWSASLITGVAAAVASFSSVTFENVNRMHRAQNMWWFSRWSPHALFRVSLHLSSLPNHVVFDQLVWKAIHSADEKARGFSKQSVSQYFWLHSLRFSF